MMTSLRIGSVQEPILEASKWLTAQVLLDVDEMAELFSALDPFALFLCGNVTKRDQGEVPHAEFLKLYNKYIAQLKEGRLPDLSTYRRWFSTALSCTSEALFSIPVGDDQQIIRISKPVIQLQALTIDYSPLDKKFHSMVFGTNNILWGIQFSYPQLYRDPTTKEVESVKNSNLFPNSHLFQTLQKWMRQHTIPTPFIVENTLTNVPIRLGKKCLPWINRHPQLVEKGIKVQE